MGKDFSLFVIHPHTQLQAFAGFTLYCSLFTIRYSLFVVHSSLFTIDRFYMAIDIYQ